MISYKISYHKTLKLIIMISYDIIIIIKINMMLKLKLYDVSLIRAKLRYDIKIKNI